MLSAATDAAAVPCCYRGYGCDEDDRASCSCCAATTLLVMRARILRRASISLAEAPSPLRLTSNSLVVVCRPLGHSHLAQFSPKDEPPRPKGWLLWVRGLEPRWLRPLPNASLPCSLRFFHEVGAKLLVEIGLEGDADTTAPCSLIFSSEGDTGKGPLGGERY
jgi:hypothetical protein